MLLCPRSKIVESPALLGEIMDFMVTGSAEQVFSRLAYPATQEHS